MSEGHVLLPNSQRPPKRSADRVRDLDAASRVQATVTLRGPELPDLDSNAPISRSDYAERYGASSEDVAKVKATLERFGLVVRDQDVSRAGRSMRVSGTAEQIEQAFHPDLGVYHSPDQGEFRGRAAGELQIPAELDGLVTGVFGLDERRVARRGTGAPAATKAPVASRAALGPNDLETRYNFPSGDGEGQKIGIAEFGGAYFPADLKAFCRKHGRPEPSVRIVDAGLEPPTIAQIQRLPEEEQEVILDESGEVMMDIEIVAGLCPAAEIFVYFAKFDQRGWVDLLNMIIDGDPAALTTVTVSWGYPEDHADWSEAATKEISLRLKAAALMGITVCVSSGDDGSGDQVEDGRAHVDFPSSSPYALSVGGTMLEGDDEVIWWQAPGWRKQGGGATGGGVSAIFKRPHWQKGVRAAPLNPGGIEGRIVPDITALAGPPFYDLVFLGKTAPNGGTSASAPVWAALIARMKAAGWSTQNPKFLAPLLYQGGPKNLPRGEEGCVDIVTGMNESPEPGLGYGATEGYDAVSGWGAPNGKDLLAALI
jgi:kumamolisin